MIMERRLIEEFLPVRAISYEATREKLLRKRDYHIAMLHFWWARLPLAAARAAVYATLVRTNGRADDPHGLASAMTALCRWGGPTGAPETAVTDARRQVLAEAGGEPPRILDCFAGGGAIPLEVTRLGGEAYAVELNPVAYLILQCTLVFPQTYGTTLADDVEKWGQWIIERAKADLAKVYPSAAANERDVQLSLDGPPGASAKGLRPAAYLWTRTVPCPNPALPPHELHLVRQTWLAKRPGKKKAGKFVALRPLVDRNHLNVHYEVCVAATPEGLGFDPEEGSERGDASCRICGAAVSANDVKRFGRDGKLGCRLMGAVALRKGARGKSYFGSHEASALVPDPSEVRRCLDTLLSETGLTIPDTRLAEEDNQHFQAPMYGMKTVGDVFTERQLLALLTLCRYTREAHTCMLASGVEVGRAKAITTLLAMAVDRVADRCSSLCHWDSTRETTANTFARQALPMVWDFSETNPFGGSSGDFGAAVDQVAKVVRHCAATGRPAVVTRGSATEAVQGGPFDAVITDPPYYDNISYADLSDFFYAWLQRSVGHLYPEHLAGPSTPKKKEIAKVPYRFGGDDQLAKQAYDDMMAEVFTRRREELKPGAPLVVVYAHKTYDGWSTLINALRRAGFAVVEAWPLDTAMPTRSVGQGTASLASAIFLVARRRENDRTGDWAADVYPELQRLVAERVRTLPAKGVSGDDLVIAAIGAGLRAYTQYARVELPNGEELAPDRYLDEVQREVIETVLSDVFGMAKAGIRVVDQPTQFYVMGRFEFGPAWVDFDRANTLGKGVGVEMVGPRSIMRGGHALLEKDGSKVRLRDYLDRGGPASLGVPDGAGSRPPLIDVLHRLLWLAEKEPRRVRDFVLESTPDADRLRLVAQALSGAALSRKGVGTSTREQTAIASLLGSWKRLIEENLFRGRS